jgi:phosphoketolase
LGVNLGYHYHSEQGLHFIPAYLNARINFSDKEDSFFLRGGFGKLIGIGSNFESGTYSKVGLGIQTQKIGLIGLEFNYKEIGFRDLEGLESISLFLEYILF